MGKKFLALLLALVMTLSFIPTAFAAEGEEEPAGTVPGAPAEAGEPSGEDSAEPEGDSAYTGGFTLGDDRTVENTDPSGEGLTVSGGGSDKAGVEDMSYVEGLHRTDPGFATKYSDQLTETHDPNEKVKFIVVTKNQPLIERFSTQELTTNTYAVVSARRVLDRSISTIASSVSSAFKEEDKDLEIGATFNVITTAFTVETEYGNKELIEAQPGVEYAYVAPTFTIPEDQIENYEFSVTGDGYTLAPLTFNSGNMIGANVVQASGYTGVGTKIAIIDSGLTGAFGTHPSFDPSHIQALISGKETAKKGQVSNYLTQSELASIYPQLHAAKDEMGMAYSQLMYRNAKIPFGFTYVPGTIGHYTYDFSHDNEDHKGSDHGTHVAGIAAGDKTVTDNGLTICGIAPDAQIIPMKVFQDGGASMDTVMLALEDAVLLGVDCVNLSLGMTAGFTEADPIMSKVLERCQEAGLNIVMAAGNDGNNGEHTWNGTGYAMIENPDNGLVGAPASYNPSLCVASVDNNQAYFNYFLFGEGDDERKVAAIDGYQSTGYLTEYTFEDFVSGRVNDYNWDPEDENAEMPTTELTFIYVGLGTSAEYEALKEKGVTFGNDNIVAVARRGNEITFPERQEAATQNGIKLLLVANNEPGVINIVLKDNQRNTDATTCLILQEDGDAMEAAFEKWLEDFEKWNSQSEKNDDDKPKLPTLRLVPTSLHTYVDIPTGVSTFSSWGVMPDLTLKPDIAGVGGNILSSICPILSQARFGTMSGTSMATPQVTGAMALITDYLRQTYPALSAPDRRDLATRLALTYANPLKADAATGLEFSPREQGAGLINVEKILDNQNLSYFTCEDTYESRPKGEMGDDPNRTGELSYDFAITNLGKDDLTYTFKKSVFTETILNDMYIGATPYALEGDNFLLYAEQKPVADFNDDGKITTEDAYILLLDVLKINEIPRTDATHYKMRDVNKDGTVDVNDVHAITDYCADIMPLLTTWTVTVPAGETLRMKAVIQLTDENKEYLNRFPNGIYVEGYLYATPSKVSGDTTETLAEMSMPFIGFYGDWSEAPVFDTTDIQHAELYPMIAFTYGSQIGYNPYRSASTRFGEQYNFFSTNNPIYEIDFGTFRNLKALGVDVVDANTGITYYSETHENVTKTYNTAYGLMPNSLYDDLFWDGRDLQGNPLPDGTRVTVKLSAYLDDGDDRMDDFYSFTATLDDTPPELLNVEDLTCGEQRPHRGWWIDENGSLMLHLEIKENQYLGAVLLAENPLNIYNAYEFNNTPGQNISIDVDISAVAHDHFKLVIGDYACNEVTYILDLDLEGFTNRPEIIKLDKTRMYGCETYDSNQVLTYGWFTAPLNGATIHNVYNLTTDTSSRYYGGEFINGYVVAQSLTGDIYLFSPYEGTWTSELIYDQKATSNKDEGWFILGDISMDYSTNTLYANGWSYEKAKEGEEPTVKDTNNVQHNCLFELTFDDKGCNVKKLYDYSMATSDDPAPNLEVMTVTTKGDMYAIDVNANLYSVEKETGKITYIGQTDFAKEPNFDGADTVQSFFFDHNTGKAYWAASCQFHPGVQTGVIAYLYEVDLTSGKLTKVGDWGPSGATACFVPNDLITPILKVGITPKNYEIEDLNMVEGTTQKPTISWSPWTAKNVDVTFTCDEEGLTIEGYKITGDKPGDYTVTAHATIAQYDDEGNETPIEVERKFTVRVFQSVGDLYAYVAYDMSEVSPYDGQVANYILKWAKYADNNLDGSEDITYYEGGNKVNPMDQGEQDARWFGGAYYKGSVYTTHVINQFQKDTTDIYSSFGVYKTDIEYDDEGNITGFGYPELVAQTKDSLQGEIYGIGVDYSTGRLYYTTSILKYSYVDLNNYTFGPMMDYQGLEGKSYGRTLGFGFTVYLDKTQNKYFGAVTDGKNQIWKVELDTGKCEVIGKSPEKLDNAFIGAMAYSFDNDAIYWAPTTGGFKSTMYMAKITSTQKEDGTYETRADIASLGSVGTWDGKCQSALFCIPTTEPASGYTPLTEVELSRDTVSGVVDGKAYISETRTPEYNSAPKTKWTSSNPEIATVNDDGYVTFVGAGTATLTATIDQSIGKDAPNLSTAPQTLTKTVTVTSYAKAGHTLYAYATDYSGIGNDGYGHGIGKRFVTIDDDDLWNLGTPSANLPQYTLKTATYFDGCFYGYTTDGAFLKIDAGNTEKYTNLGIPKSHSVNAMAYDYAKGVMYGVGGTGFGTIDVTTGEFTKDEKAGLNVSASAMTFDQEGNLYLIAVKDNKSVLYKVTPSVGEQEGSGFDFSSMETPLVTFEGIEGTSKAIAYDWENNRVYVHFNSPTNRLYFVDLGEKKGAEEAGAGETSPTVVELDSERFASDASGALDIGLMCFLPNEGEGDTELYANEDDIPLNTVKAVSDLVSIEVDSEFDLKAQLIPSVAGEEYTLEYSAADVKGDEELESEADESSVVSVTDGKVKAEKTGEATVTITVKKDDQEVKKVEVKVKVEEKNSGDLMYTVEDNKLVSFHSHTPGTTTEVADMTEQIKDKQVYGLDVGADSVYVTTWGHSAFLGPCFDLYKVSLSDDHTVTFLGSLLTQEQPQNVDMGGIIVNEESDIIYLFSKVYGQIYTLGNLDPNAKENKYINKLGDVPWGWSQSICDGILSGEDGGLLVLSDWGAFYTLDKDLVTFVPTGARIPTSSISILFSLTHFTTGGDGKNAYFTDSLGRLYSFDASKLTSSIEESDITGYGIVGHGNAAGLAAAKTASEDKGAKTSETQPKLENGTPVIAVPGTETDAADEDESETVTTTDETETLPGDTAEENGLPGEDTTDETDDTQTPSSDTAEGTEDTTDDAEDAADGTDEVPEADLDEPAPAPDTTDDGAGE